MPLLDTSFIIDLLRGDPKIREVVGKIGGQRLGTAIFCKYELVRGAGKSDEVKVMGLLDTLSIHHFTEEAMQESVKIYKALRDSGMKINEIDILIAGTSIASREILYVRDKDFDKINSPYVVRV